MNLSDQMPFQRFALFFRQDFSGGYRYLDHCGDFMVAAEQEFSLTPSGDTSPSGGKMENPELGIRIEFNSTVLRVVQELPGDGTEKFAEHVEYLARLYYEKFKPVKTERVGVALHSFTSFNNVDQAESVSLKWGGSYHNDLAKLIGMPAKSRTVEYNYNAGSRNLRIKFYPATFEKVQIAKRNVGSRATSYQKEQARRQNIGANRTGGLQLAHAFFVDLDLTEDDPPENTFAGLLADLISSESKIQSALDF